MAHAHGKNSTKSGDCGCNSGCVKCKEVFTIQMDCCNKCGHKSCDSKSCCSSCDEGPMDVTNEELGSECSFFWASVWRNCCLQPIRVSPSRFRAFLLEGAELTDFVNMEELEQKICDLVDEKSSGFVSNSSFIALRNKVDKNCKDIASIQTFVSNLVFPDVSGFLTQNDLDGLELGLTKTEVENCINLALQDYYTQEQVNAIVANVQNQVTALGESLTALQAQLDACDCGSGGNSGGVTAPTLDSNFDDLTENVCPQCVTKTVTNPDGVLFCVESTGNGIVTASVDGGAVGNISEFMIADASTLEVCLSGQDGENVVGGINVSWIDADGSKQVLDGLTYNVTCPDDNGNSGSSSLAISCGNPADINHTGGTAQTYSYTSTVTGGTEPYTFEVIGIDPPVRNYFNFNADGSYTVNFPSGYDTTFGPQNWLIKVTDAVGDTAQCSGGQITVTGNGPIN